MTLQFWSHRQLHLKLTNFLLVCHSGKYCVQKYSFQTVKRLVCIEFLSNTVFAVNKAIILSIDSNNQFAESYIIDVQYLKVDIPIVNDGANTR